jgi:hypothetical protein
MCCGDATGYKDALLRIGKGIVKERSPRVASLDDQQGTPFYESPSAS